MAEPTVGESRKKGIAVTAITALVAYKPTNRTELAVAGCVTLITIVALCIFAYLEKKPNISIDKPPVPPIE